MTFATLALVSLLAGPTVDLKFAWPARLRCDVERKATTSLIEGVEARETIHRLRWDVRRTPRGFGVRQTFLGASFGRQGGPADSSSLQLQYPDFEVDPHGAFIDVAFTPEQKAQLRAAVERRAELSRALARPLPDQDLEKSTGRTVARVWRDLVEKWNGTQLEPGVPSKTPTEQDTDLEMVGRVHAQGEGTVTLATRVPCARPPRGGCVRIQVVSDARLTGNGAEPVPAAGAANNESGLAAAIKAGKVRAHVIDALVTDGRTLIPRTLTHTFDIELPGGVLGPGGAKAPATRIRTADTMTFRCGR